MNVTTYEGDLSDVERDPRLLELAMRQRKAMRDFSVEQAVEYLRLATKVKTELMDT